MRCTGITGKPCDQCRALREKCSNAGVGAEADSDSYQESDVGAKKPRAGVKRKEAEGGSQSRKRPRKNTDITEFDADVITKVLVEADDVGCVRCARMYELMDKRFKADEGMRQWYDEETKRRAKSGKKGKRGKS
jgi:hypothetical protein